MFGRIPDINDMMDYEEAESEKRLESYPECAECGEKILDECYEINDCLICPECLEDNHRRCAEDYAEC